MDYKKILSKEINSKIIKFFKNNPNSVETVDGIKGWLEVENRITIQRALEKLSELGVLAKHESTGVNGYGLTQSEEVNEKINNYLDL